MSRRMQPPRAVALAMVLMLGALLGCGSTAQLDTGTTAAEDIVPAGGSPQQATVGGGLTDSGHKTSASSAQAGSGVDGGSAATSAGGRGLGPDVTTAQPGLGQTSVDGPGVTASSIYLGLTYTKSQDAANAGVTGADINSGDARLYYNALIAEVNKGGGILGHRLVPLYFGVDPTSSQTVDQQAQAACSYWTEDHKVFAVLDAGQELLRKCVTKAGALHLTTEWSTSTAHVYRAHPNYVEVGALSLDRIGRTSVDGLARLDYFKGTPKVGLITWDDPAYIEGMKKSWLPALSRHGIGSDHVEVEYAPPPQNYDGIGNSTAAISSAILKFRQNNIQNVIIADGPAGVFGGTGLTLLFIKDASSQKYYPRYGMNSANSPDGGLSTGLWTPEEVPGSVAVEWQSHVADPLRPVVAHCFDVMHKAGVTMGNDNAKESALIACDLVYFLRAAVSAGGGAITLPAALGGITRLGSSYSSTVTFATSFSNTKHNGTDVGRLSVLDPPCNCYKWTGAPYKF